MFFANHAFIAAVASGAMPARHDMPAAVAESDEAPPLHRIVEMPLAYGGMTPARSWLGSRRRFGAPYLPLSPLGWSM
jgi:hypothetical protein